MHGLADLLWGLLFLVEFLLVHAVLSGEKGSQFSTAFLKVSLVLSTQFVQTTFNDLLSDDLVSLVLPVGIQSEVLVTVDLSQVFLQFLNYNSRCSCNGDLRTHSLCEHEYGRPP